MQRENLADEKSPLLLTSSSPTEPRGKQGGRDASRLVRRDQLKVSHNSDATKRVRSSRLTGFVSRAWWVPDTKHTKHTLAETTRKETKNDRATLL